VRPGATEEAPHNQDAPMPPLEQFKPYWPVIGIGVAAAIAITGWFVVHHLAKRRELQKEQRDRDTAAANESDRIEASQRLTEPEREILRYCMSADGTAKGCVRIMRTDQAGSWVRAGSHNFIDEGDSSIQAIYLDAFNSLTSRGCFRDESGSGKNHSLTGIGYEMANQNT